MSASTMIEPCCCERQAPTVMTEYGRRTAMWTNGDVTLDHWFRALSYKAGPNHQMTLLVRRVDVQMLRWVRQWMNRGWTTRLQLTTAEPCADMVATELEGLTDRVSLAVDGTQTEELLLMLGNEGAMMISGRMLSQPEAGLKVYAVVHGKGTMELTDLISAIDARHRMHRVEIAKAEEEQKPTFDEAQGSPEPKQKRSTRKKKS